MIDASASISSKLMLRHGCRLDGRAGQGATELPRTPVASAHLEIRALRGFPRPDRAPEYPPRP
jgi:hypothetical protein